MKARQDFILFVGTIVLFGYACSNGPTTQQQMMSAAEVNAEKYRPGFHFTPQKNWMNDPNGMFYLNGTFHLYFRS